MRSSAVDLRLRPLRAGDEHDAIAAHEELAREGFEFLLGWRSDQPWATYLRGLERLRRGLERPPDKVVSVHRRLLGHLQLAGR